jgi:hypothetical protein
MFTGANAGIFIESAGAECKVLIVLMIPWVA